MITDLVLKNTYRRFYENHKINLETLRELVALARITPSAANRQSLKYVLSNTEGKNSKIFETLAWAGYLKEWDGPEPGERPSAYIIVLGDLEIGKNYFDVNAGIAMQSILLGAVEKELGGCIFAAINRELLAMSLSIPERYQVLYVIALGKPKEKVVIDDIIEDDIEYWRDKDATHHVPKRTLDELILNL